MKKFIDKYYLWIVIILAILLFFKNCQSCTRGRAIEFNEISYELIIDSMKTDINNYKTKLILLEDSINVYKTKNEELQDKINILKESNKHFQQTNRVLINTNKELIKEY